MSLNDSITMMIRSMDDGDDDDDDDDEVVITIK